MPSITSTSLVDPTTSLIAFQLSYSTADIEQSVFYGSVHELTNPVVPHESITLLVVNSEFFVLEEKPIPQPAIPLTEEAGLFKIVGIADKP